MFSSLRSIIHQTSRIRRAFIAPRAAFSSTSLVLNTAYGPEYSQMQGVLAEEGSKQENKSPSFQAGVPAGSFQVKKKRLREFYRNQPIHPHHFERDMREWKTSKRLKPWDLGLPTREARYHDVFHQLNIDPVNECMNTTLLSHFVSKMGMVNKRALTKLTMRSQRKVSKAIKRAKMMGIIPIHSQAPRGLLNFS